VKSITYPVFIGQISILVYQLWSQFGVKQLPSCFLWLHTTQPSALCGLCAPATCDNRA